MNRASVMKRVAYTSGACIIVLILAVLAPWIVTTTWHLTHAQKQQYSGYEMSIPDGFILSRTSNGIRLIHPKTVASSKLYSFSKIDIQGGGARTNIGIWEKEAVRTTLQNGFRNVSSFELNAAGDSSACVVRDENDGSEISRVAYCKTGGGLTLQYFGGQEDLTQLRGVLQNLKLQ